MNFGIKQMVNGPAEAADSTGVVLAAELAASVSVGADVGAEELPAELQAATINDKTTGVVSARGNNRTLILSPCCWIRASLGSSMT
jgi:hypothetical protein